MLGATSGSACGQYARRVLTNSPCRSSYALLFSTDSSSCLYDILHHGSSSDDAYDRSCSHGCASTSASSAHPLPSVTVQTSRPSLAGDFSSFSTYQRSELCFSLSRPLGPSSSRHPGDSWSTLWSLAFLRHNQKKRAIPDVGIAPDSPVLGSYKKELHPRQLTFRIGKREKLQELHDLVALYPTKLDGIAVAALLKQIRTCQLKDDAYDPALAQKLVTTCCEKLIQRMKWTNLQEVTASLWALAKLQDTRTPAHANHPDHPPPTAPPKALLKLIAKAARSRSTLLEAPPRRLMTFVWSISKLLPDHYQHEVVQDALDKVAICSLKRLQNFQPVDLSAFASAYTKIGPLRSSPPPPHPEEAPPAAPSTTTTDTGSTSTPSSWPPAGAEFGSNNAPTSPEASAITAHENRQKRNTRILQAVAAEFVTRVGNLAFSQPEPRDLAVLAEAFSTSKFPDLKVLGAISKGARAVLSQFRPAELVMLIQAYADLGVKESQLLTAVQKLIVETQAKHETQLLETLLGLYLKLGARSEELQFQVDVRHMKAAEAAAASSTESSGDAV